MRANYFALFTFFTFRLYKIIVKRPYMSRAERLASGLRTVARISELTEIHGWNYPEVSRYQDLSGTYFPKTSSYYDY